MLGAFLPLANGSQYSSGGRPPDPRRPSVGVVLAVGLPLAVGLLGGARRWASARRGFLSGGLGGWLGYWS